jgi:hypothetical protein
MACPGQGDIEQPSFFGVRIGLRLGQHQLKERIINPFRGEFASLETDDDDVIGLQPL